MERRRTHRRAFRSSTARDRHVIISDPRYTYQHPNLEPLLFGTITIEWWTGVSWPHIDLDNTSILPSDRSVTSKALKAYVIPYSASNGWALLIEVQKWHFADMTERCPWEGGLDLIKKGIRCRKSRNCQEYEETSKLRHAFTPFSSCTVLLI